MGKSAGSISRMSSATAVAPLAARLRWIARATSSRGASSSTKRSPLASSRRGALAADGLGDAEALAPGDADHGGRVELDELEVGELGAGAVGQQQADAERARRVRRPRPERGGAAGGRSPGAGAAIRRPSSQATPTQRPSRTSSPLARAFSITSIAGSSATRAESWRITRRPGRAPAGVDDAAQRVAALEAEGEPAEAVGVEADAELLELAHLAGRLVAEDAGRRRAHEAAPGALGVGEVQRSGCRRPTSAAARPPWAQ